MKNCLVLALVLLNYMSFAQNCPISKSNMDTIEFTKEITDTGGVTYFFKMDGKRVGPAVSFELGNIEYYQYDKKGRKDGFFKRKTDEGTLYGEYDKGIEKGDFFLVQNAVVKEAYELSKSGKKKPTDKLYQTNKSYDGYGRGNTDDGFGVLNKDRDDGGTNVFMGYWKSDEPSVPHVKYIIQDEDISSVQAGKLKGWDMNGFTVIEWSDGDVFMGYTDDSIREGLGLFLKKGTDPYIAGWYKDDECVIDLIDE